MLLLVIDAKGAAMEAFGELETVHVNGTSLAYRELGSGEPVVFVHGGLSDLRTWMHQLPAVAESRRAIAYSRRYARPNDDIEPGADDQMLPHVDDLAAFVRAVGNSWGAFICLLTAIRHPDVVRSLVLEEPPVLPLVIGAGSRPEPGTLVRNLIRRPRTTLPVLGFGVRAVAPLQKAFRRGDDTGAMETFVHAVLGQEPYAALPAARKQQMRENLSALRAQMLGAGFPPLSTDDVRRVRVPVLLVTGERSPAFLLRLSDRLEELLPNVERVEIAGASHAMHEENPPALNAAIERFLHEARSSGRDFLPQPR
jgi:pimeloyl-ACP methyl ester carboxylesterase